MSMLSKTKSTARQNQITPPVTVNPGRMGGQSVIGTSRVPVGAILDYVDREALRRDFPSISADALENAIKYLKELGEDGALGESITY